jgi:excinuclease ABC subunit C
MMREVLRRRFKRLVDEVPRPVPAPTPAADVDAPAAAADTGGSTAAAGVPEPSGSPIGEAEPEHAPAGGREGQATDADVTDADVTDADSLEAGAAADHDAVAWPDLVLIDGGAGQLNAAREIFSELGIADLPMVAIAKGPDRDAGRETFHMPGRPAFKLPPRDPVLYFVERLRDEAHRFAIGSHRQRRRRDIREAGLQEIAGIGPTRKRALLRHFGTLKAIERASVADLRQVPGVSDETARRIYDFFHDAGR